MDRPAGGPKGAARPLHLGGNRNLAEFFTDREDRRGKYHARQWPGLGTVLQKISQNAVFLDGSFGLLGRPIHDPGSGWGEDHCHGGQSGKSLGERELQI